MYACDTIDVLPIILRRGKRFSREAAADASIVPDKRCQPLTLLRVYIFPRYIGRFRKDGKSEPAPPASSNAVLYNITSIAVKRYRLGASGGFEYIKAREHHCRPNVRLRYVQAIGVLETLDQKIKKKSIKTNNRFLRVSRCYTGFREQWELTAEKKVLWSGKDNFFAVRNFKMSYGSQKYHRKSFFDQVSAKAILKNVFLRIKRTGIIMIDKSK